MSNDQLHNTAGANLSVGDVSLSVAGVAGGGNAPALITLTGSGFGVESPLLNYDTFDYALADGAEIPLTDKYDANGGPYSNKMLFDSANKLEGRSGAMTGVNKSEVFPLALSANRSIGKIYVTWWQMFSVRLSDSTIFSRTNRSDKIIRIWDHQDGTRLSWTQQHATFPISSTESALNYGTKLYLGQTAGEWDRYEVAIEGGSLKLMRNGVSMTDGVVSNFYDRMPDLGYYVNRLGYDMSEDTDVISGKSFTNTIADWYSRGGQARVELSNTPAWGASGEFKRYIQKHDSWSDGSISISEPFYGDLDKSAGAIYCHVVLADGNVVDKGPVN